MWSGRAMACVESIIITINMLQVVTTTLQAALHYFPDLLIFFNRGVGGGNLLLDWIRSQVKPASLPCFLCLKGYHDSMLPPGLLVGATRAALKKLAIV